MSARANNILFSTLFNQASHDSARFLQQYSKYSGSILKRLRALLLTSDVMTGKERIGRAKDNRKRRSPMAVSEYLRLFSNFSLLNDIFHP